MARVEWHCCINERRAYELVLWVPLAFGRYVLSGLELGLPEYYRVLGTDNSVTLRRKPQRRGYLCRGGATA